MDNTDGYQIKRMLEYVELKEEAQNKLFNSSERAAKQLLEGIVLFVVGMILASLFIFTDPVDLPQTVMVKYVTAMIGVYVVILAILIFIKSFKTFIKNVEYYKGDLRRIQEKLTYSDIYMDIPQEDFNEFDNIFNLIFISLKRLKKST